MTTILESRKFIVFFLSAATMIMLRRLGIEPDALFSMGIDLGAAQEWGADIMVGALLPAWLGWAWPNDPEAGILDYWKVALSGIVVILTVAGLIMVL